MRPDVTALSPGLLARLLSGRDRQLAMAESQRAILEGFGRRVPALASAPRSTSALQSGLESRGLTATPFDGGSLYLLRRLDHPVLLPLKPTRTHTAASNSEPCWLAITGFKDDRARVAGLISNRVVTVPIDELAEHWLETGIIVWERFDRVAEELRMGEKGRGILWLQRSLAELHFFEARPSGTFDGVTLAALTRFQRKNGLVSDGIAGPLTQIALYGQLDRYPVPRLSGDEPARARSASSTIPTPSRVGVTESSGDRG